MGGAVGGGGTVAPEFGPGFIPKSNVPESCVVALLFVPTGPTDGFVPGSDVRSCSLFVFCPVVGLLSDISRFVSLSSVICPIRSSSCRTNFIIRVVVHSLYLLFSLMRVFLL